MVDMDDQWRAGQCLTRSSLGRGALPHLQCVLISRCKYSHPTKFKRPADADPGRDSACPRELAPTASDGTAQVLGRSHEFWRVERSPEELERRCPGTITFLSGEGTPAIPEVPRNPTSVTKVLEPQSLLFLNLNIPKSLLCACQPPGKDGTRIFLF